MSIFRHNVLVRRNVLLRSVERVLGGNVDVRDAAYMWSRHRWSLPFAGAVLVGLILLAPVFGIDDWPTRIVIGLGGMGVGITATTDYAVVAETGKGLFLMKASRIRQVAVAIQEKLARDGALQRVGGTVLASDWQIGSRRYTVARSSEDAMERMALRRGKDDPG